MEHCDLRLNMGLLALGSRVEEVPGGPRAALLARASTSLPAELLQGGGARPCLHQVCGYERPSS